MSQPPLSAAGTAMTPARRNRQRLCLLLLIALFLLPLLAASWLVGYWRPTATTNHGELLATARPVVPFTVTRSGGTALAADYLRRRWTLAYLGAAGECGQPCRDALYYIRQVRLALGKDLERVQALFLMATAPGTEQLGWLAREHPELTSGVADAATRAFFRDAFPNGAAEGEWIYLIDPLGNLFMRYPAAMRAEREAKGLLEDLRHLLKYSKLG